MPDLGGFQVVAELTVDVLSQFLAGAWQNSIIPHSYPLPDGTAFGPYHLSGGAVNIPLEGLSLAMDPGDNGVRITMNMAAQAQILDPLVPSLSLFDLQAETDVGVPLGEMPGTVTHSVGALLDTVPRSSVHATLTSGDPIPPITLTIITEYLHARYTDNTIPHTDEIPGASLDPLGLYKADVLTEIFDDPSDSTRQIQVTEPATGQVELRIPVHVRMSNLTITPSPPIPPPEPMGVTARIVITVQLLRTPGLLTVKLSTAGVTVGDFAPASGSTEYDLEGTNYTFNKNFAQSLYGIDLDAAIQADMVSRGEAILATLGDTPGGDKTFTVPTVGQIETFIADQVHAAVTGRGNISIWTPDLPESGEVTVDDLKILALADALAICLNNAAGDTSVISDFIPAGNSCSIGMDGAKIIQLINDQVDKPESDGGLGGIPYTFDASGHTAHLTKLDPSLRDGSIHLYGEVTVENAIAGYIDADTSFDADVGLEWVDDPTSGGQKIHAFTITEPDVHLSGLTWFLSILVGFVTLSIVGVIIAAVVMKMADDLANQIGGEIFEDHVTGQVVGIAPWPQHLEGIGEVTTRFENPVLIDTQSVIFPDIFIVVATYASTVVASAKTNGPYSISAGFPATLTGGPGTPATTYGWDLGDGTVVAARKAVHTYARGGTYVARFTTTVNQEGGATTREYTLVHARHLPPQVTIGPDRTVDEGEEFEIIAQFTDVEWLDTHTAIFDFGDNSLPVITGVTETNEAPQGYGEARAKHAYCDNGKYPVTVEIQDDNGCIGSATLWMTVRNVPPSIESGEDVFAYPGIPITLEACFTDPGWCDTHTAAWDFGDCSPPLPAIIREQHKPPAGVGVAAATHIYERCGNYRARCVVIDDDGGKDEESIVVKVVKLKNADFENGYRKITAGVVANHWEPYTRDTGGGKMNVSENDLSADSLFSPDEFIVRNGRRSQRIDARGAGRTGIYQRIGANRNWDYQLSAWYAIDERGTGVCRLGIDPDGGLDPNALSIVWSAGHLNHEWAQLSGRVTAKKKAITVFLELESDRDTRSAWFDSVSLIPYPCGLKRCRPALKTEEKKCVDWSDEKSEQEFKTDYGKNGFTFHTLAADSVRIQFSGQPSGQGKLRIPARGLQVTLPFECVKVSAHVYTGGTRPVRMEAFDRNGSKTGEITAPTGQFRVSPLDLTGSGIAGVRFSDGGNESLLVDLCIWRAGAASGVEINATIIGMNKGR
jgi:hypothetical protein